MGNSNLSFSHSLLRTCICMFMMFGGLPLAWGQYCLPSYNSPCTSDDFINSVQFVTINNTNTGCTSPGTNNYTNYSGTISTTVTAGATNTITVAPGPTWGQYFVAFIDINHDTDYNDAGEFFDIGYSLGGGQVSAPITIPCGAMPGLTRMRIMCRYANTPLTQSDVCTTGLSFGEVEEYGLNITMPGYTDAGVAGFTAPVTACGLGASNPVSVSIYNCGGTTITSAQICYTFQGGPSQCETATISLAPGMTYTHTFASTVNMSTAGNYTFTASVTVAADAVPGNNNLVNHVVTHIPVITTLPFSRNFDANDGGFTIAGTNPSWEWGTPSNVFINAAASAPKAWVTNLDSTYNAGELSYLISPCFNFSSLTADPFISFSHIYELPGFGDEHYLEVTTNAGATWSKLGTATSGGNNWYDDPFTNSWTATSGNAGQWRTADHRMTGTAGSANVRFRFVMSSDNFFENEGVGIDNLRIRDTIFNAGVVEINSPLNGCNLGSTETVSVEVANFGTHTINNFPVCFIIDNGAPVCQNVTTPIPAGDTITFTFTSTANVSTQGPHTVASYSALLRDSIRDNDSSMVSIVNFPVITANPYFQNFEAGQGNWISNGVNNDWAFGTPFKAVISGAASGSNAWVTGTTGFFNYANDQDSWVESPCFDISSLTNPWVALKIWWESETNWDAGLLEYSTNGGNNWTQIGDYGDPYYWYNDSSFIALTNAGLQGDGWGGTVAASTGSGAYVQAKHEIGNLTGATSVRFRLHFLSDGSVAYDGIAFDNFAIGTPPTVDLGNDTLVCSSLVLNANLPSNGIFAWSNNQTTSSITVTTSGDYVLTYTDSLGLTGKDTIHVTINPTPPVNLGPNQVICATTTECFTVNSVAYPNILWSTGATTPTICVGTAGSFSVQVTDSAGCTSADTIQTTVVPLPNPNLGPDTTACFGQTICFNSGLNPQGLSFLWSTGATTPTICSSIIAGYWVSVTDQNGCTKSDSIIVTAGPLVPTSAMTIDTTGCPVVQFVSTASGQISNYAWSFGDGGLANTANASHDYTSSGNGVYTISHIVSNECGADTTTSTISVTCLVNIDAGALGMLRMYPNPSMGKFWLSVDHLNGNSAEVSIFDLNGQEVYHNNFDATAGPLLTEVDLSTKAAGVYMVRFKAGDVVKTEKLIIE